MPRSVVFQTQGKLDLRSLTTFGLSSKPNSQNPIGYFGTGMKYAVAVLLRHNLDVVIFVNQRKWSFKVNKTVFRQKEFFEIELVRHKAFGLDSHIKLPFTTELGRNWSLWQAFRELYANTLDENGETFIPVGLVNSQRKGRTQIVVTGEPFVEEFIGKDKTFLPDALRESSVENGTIQRFDRPSQYVYYRGMRVMDLPDPSIYTWNILSQLELTEDRTAKNAWDVKNRIAQYISTHDELDVVKAVITAPEKSMERDLSYTYHVPSTTFISAVQQSQALNIPINHTASDVVKNYAPKVKKKLTDEEALRALSQAIRLNNYSEILELVEPYKQAITTALDYCADALTGNPDSYKGDDDDIPGQTEPNYIGGGDLPDGGESHVGALPTKDDEVLF